jgi:DNA-binding transcriptional regulator YiaG
MTRTLTEASTMPSRNDIRLAFADRLKTIRYEKGYKQVFCALQVGVSEREWQRWEGGRFLPHPHAYNALLKLFPNIAPDICRDMSGIN